MGNKLQLSPVTWDDYGPIRPKRKKNTVMSARARRVTLYLAAFLGVAGCILCLILILRFDWDKWRRDREVLRIFDATGQTLEQRLSRLAQPNLPLSENAMAKIARKCGPSAIPTIVGMLTTPDYDPGAQAVACLVLAKMPGTEGRDAIIAYVRGRLSAQQLTREQTTGLAGSMVALAQIADEVSLKFLEEIAGRSYWQPPRVTPVLHRRGEEDLTGDKARLYLREMAMDSGLGSVVRERQPEVIEILRRLKEGDASDIYGRIDFRIQSTERHIASKPSRDRVTP